MDLKQFLAMTGAEFAFCEKKPEHIAWMACHFSPYGTGLSNRPNTLPKGSMLILNDRIPICGHDPEQISDELKELVSGLECESVLLDLQREKDPETSKLVRVIVSGLSCPVGVSDLYAGDLQCPVFLPPPPLDVSLDEFLAPWDGRELWLEAALDAAQFTVTEKGSTFLPIPYSLPEGSCHKDTDLHCTYQISVNDTCAVFKLYRTTEDLSDLLRDAAKYGVTRSIGLYQQLKRGLLS